jgi:hypothetical protein
VLMLSGLGIKSRALLGGWNDWVTGGGKVVQ